MLIPSWATKLCMTHVQAMGQVTALAFNSSGLVTCFDISVDLNTSYNLVYDYQTCTEGIGNSAEFNTDGMHDMFWDSGATPWQHCRSAILTR